MKMISHTMFRDLERYQAVGCGYVTAECDVPWFGAIPKSRNIGEAVGWKSGF
jgi:hypothetical protein